MLSVVKAGIEGRERFYGALRSCDKSEDEGDKLPASQESLFGPPLDIAKYSALAEMERGTADYPNITHSAIITANAPPRCLLCYLLSSPFTRET